MKPSKLLWKDQNCLVTGAFGFVGTHLCAYLASRGARVTALDWLPDTSGTFFGAAGLRNHVRILKADVRNRRELTELATERYNFAFHLAAQPIAPLSNIEPETTIEINALGTSNVGWALSKNARPPAFIFASSACWYGATTRSPLTENDPYSEGEFVYSKSKVCAEEEVWELDERFDIPTIRCRFVNLYGPGDRHFSRVVPKTIRHLLREESPQLSRNDGTTVLDFMHVGDAVTALTTAAQSVDAFRGEVFNFGIAGSHPIEVRKLLTRISKTFDGQHREPIFFNAQTPKTKEKYLDNSKATARLGWKPTMTLGEGLLPTIEWYRAHLHDVEHLEF